VVHFGNCLPTPVCIYAHLKESGQLQCGTAQSVINLNWTPISIPDVIRLSETPQSGSAET